MYKIQKPKYVGYDELSQPVPLRWVVAYADEDNNLIPQTGWWKCKDFMNDVVLWLRTGEVFEIYGFENNITINEDGAFFLLKNVPAFFEHNFSLMNEFLLERGFDALDLCEHDGNYSVEKVVFVPGMYWDNTFMMSVITSLIRSCCYEAWTNGANFEVEPTLNGWWSRVVERFVPENVDMMNDLIFLNYNYNGKSDLNMESMHICHNAGLQTWINSWNSLKEAA